MSSLMAFFGLDGTKFSQGLDKAVAEAGKKGPSIEGALMGGLKSSRIFSLIASPIGAASTAAIAFIGGIIEKVDELRARAKEIKIGAGQSGLSQGAYQDVFNAAQSSGASTEAIPKAVLKIAEAQEKVKRGGEGADKALQAFSDVGITLQEIQSNSYQQLFEKISNSMHVATLSGEQMTAGAELMGKGFESLLPAFQRGFLDPADQMKKLSDEKIAELNEMNRTIGITKAIWSTAWEEMSMSAVSGLSAQTEGLAGFLVKFSGLGLAAKGYRAFMGNSGEQDSDVVANGKRLQEAVDKQQADRANKKNAARIKELADQKAFQKNSAEAAAINEQTQKEEKAAKLRAMPKPERLAELRQETAELEKQAAILEAKLKTEKDAADAPALAKLRREIAQNNLASAELGKTDKSDKKISLNSNQSVGAYAGGVADKHVAIAQKSQQHLAKIETDMGKLLMAQIERHKRTNYDQYDPNGGLK